MYALDRSLEGVDVIVHPSFGASLLGMTNLTGHPTVVVPNGFREDGTPTSISFTGQLFDDGFLLSVAHAWQRETDFHRRHPQLDDAQSADVQAR